MQRIKHLIASAAAIGMALTLNARPGGAQPTNLTVAINGRPVTLDPAPIERAGRIYVPLRGVFERLGASVVYDAGRINATKGTNTVSLQVGSTTAAVDGRAAQLDLAPFAQAGSVFVPLRFISQALGATIRYDAATQSVTIGVPPPGRRVLRFPQG